MPRSIPEDPPVLDVNITRIKKWRDERNNRWVIDLPPLPNTIVKCTVACVGGSKNLELVGQADRSLRVYVNPKGDPDEWESPAGSGNIMYVYSPGEPTKQELLAESAAKDEARQQEEEREWEIIHSSNSPSTSLSA